MSEKDKPVVGYGRLDPLGRESLLRKHKTWNPLLAQHEEIIKQQREVLRTALAAMRATEWYDYLSDWDNEGKECNCCHHTNKHAPDCRLSAAIKQVEEALGGD